MHLNDQRARDAARRTAGAREMAAWRERDQEIRQVTSQIRDMTATLARCRTPAGRHAVRERIIPLVVLRSVLLAAQSSPSPTTCHRSAAS